MIYAQRDELLDAESVKANVDGIRDDVIFDTVARFVPPNSIDEQWDLRGLEATLESDFGLQMSLTDLVKAHEELDAEAIAAKVQERVNQHFAEKEAGLGEETMRALEKHVMLTVLDQSWKEHLARMDYLRQGIYLRGYAQKQPKQEYKKEAFELFSGHAGERQARSGDPAGPRAHPQRRGSAGAGSGRAPAGAGTPEPVAVPAPGCGRLQRRRGSRAGGKPPSRAWPRCSATSRRSAAMIRARAAVARSTSTATAS